MFPWEPEGSPEPDIIGTADADRARPRWLRYAVAGGVLALAGITVAVSISLPGQHTAARQPGSVSVNPARPVPARPDTMPTQAWAASLSIAMWPMPGSGSSSMFAGGVAGRIGWELTARDVARSGQRCTAAVVLDDPGAHLTADAYPISPSPPSRTPAGDLAFITLGAQSPGVGAGFLQLRAPAMQVWADPHRTGGFEISVPIVTVHACHHRYYLAGFAYPLAGTLDIFLQRNSTSRPVHYLVPARLSHPKASRVWQSTG